MLRWVIRLGEPLEELLIVLFRFMEHQVKEFYVYVLKYLLKSIPKGIIINVKGERLLIPFTYEKLPCLCFKCGQLLHGEGG